MKTWTKTYKILSVSFFAPERALFDDLRKTGLFSETLKDSSLEDLKREYARLFSLTVAGGIPPYETEYGHKDIFFKTQRLADVAGFYRAFGMEVSDLVPERIDFIGTELELMYWITMKEEMARETGHEEEAEICRDAAAKFLLDHLGRWGSYFGDQISKSSRHPFYKQAGQWLSQFVESECRRLKVEPERVTGWNPEPISTTEFECGPDSDPEAPQPLTITR